jgi:hypothetical protein
LAEGRSTRKKNDAEENLQELADSDFKMALNDGASFDPWSNIVGHCFGRRSHAVLYCILRHMIGFPVLNGGEIDMRGALVRGNRLENAGGRKRKE